MSVDKSKVNDAAYQMVAEVEDDQEAMESFRKGKVLFAGPFRAKDGTVLQVVCASQDTLKRMMEVA